MENEDIKKFIPQREPVIMVDRLVDVEGDVAVTVLAIRTDNYFIQNGRLLAEVGLIEHIAQSASAFAGYKAVTSGAPDAPVGYIGEVKKFHCYRCPVVGEELRTTITMGAEVAGVTIVAAETRVGDELVADTQMKIFMESDN